MGIFPPRAPCRLFAWATVLLSGTAMAAGSEFPQDFASFQADFSPAVAAQLDTTAKHYRQIEPSLFYLCRNHADTLAKLPDQQRLETIVKLATFIDRKRDATGDSVVIGGNRPLTGLLDPARGLEPQEITAIAAGYGVSATVFKQDPTTDTIREVADRFLAAVGAAAGKGTPATIVVLGHGSPEEIQSYSIPYQKLADALIGGVVDRPLPRPSGAADTTAAGTPVNLGHLVLICDDCFSADFLTNLGGTIATRCHDRGLTLTSLPIMIAGTNRDRVGHADFGEKFVPHFWKDVIELFYVRRPRPDVVTLRDFFEKVDNMMYGYGRTPIVQGGGVVSYKLVDPTLCQDPVFFVPLSNEDLAALRAILGLDAAAPLPPFLDIG